MKAIAWSGRPLWVRRTGSGAAAGKRTMRASAGGGAAVPGARGRAPKVAAVCCDGGLHRDVADDDHLDRAVGQRAGDGRAQVLQARGLDLGAGGEAPAPVARAQQAAASRPNTPPGVASSWSCRAVAEGPHRARTARAASRDRSGRRPAPASGVARSSGRVRPEQHEGVVVDGRSRRAVDRRRPAPARSPRRVSLPARPR